MTDFIENRLDFITDMLGRRSRICHLRMFFLQLQQFIKKRVVFRVRDGRFIQHVILVIVTVNELS